MISRVCSSGQVISGLSDVTWLFSVLIYSGQRLLLPGKVYRISTRMGVDYQIVFFVFFPRSVGFSVSKN